MKLTITTDLFDQYSHLVVGCIVIRDLDNTKTLPESFYESIPACARDLSSDPTLETWREVYRSFGAKPKRHLCSLENLAKYPDLYRINPLVDLYNGVSLSTWFPYGAEDLDAMSGDIVLGFADGTESFQPLGSAEIHAPKRGEVVYKDDEKVICRRWNWRESDITKVTKDSKNVVVVCEGFDQEEVQKSVNFFVQTFHQYLSGNIQTHILTKEAPECSF